MHDYIYLESIIMWKAVRRNDVRYLFARCM